MVERKRVGHKSTTRANAVFLFIMSFKAIKIDKLSLSLLRGPRHPKRSTHRYRTLSAKPAFRVGDYVRVKGDTSPGHNRPDGYAFVKQVRGHGAANTLSSIQMVEVYGGSLFHDVRIQFMTPATFPGSELAETPMRKRMAPSSAVTPSPIPKKITSNRKMPVEILVERLQHGSRHRLKKGWYFGQERIKRAAAGREGEQQLLSEALLLESYNKSKPEVVLGRGQHGHFYKTTATSKGATLQYLVRTTWGLGNAYICRLKKKAMAEYCRRRQTKVTNVLDLSVFPCMSKRHIQKSRECGGRRVLPEDEIWQNAKDVWNQLPNSKVASAHIFKVTGLQTKLSNQKAITNFLAQVGASIVGSETISNLPKMVLNERISAPNKFYNYAFILTTEFIL
jgi:hypothetical protein